MATTLLEYFNELRDQNPFSWVKDSAITAVEPGHAEMTLQTNETDYCNFRGDLHGAVCIGLADSVMGTACFTIVLYIGYPTQYSTAFNSFHIVTIKINGANRFA